MEHCQQKVYFDHEGQLVRRLGITQVPARVEQEETQLRVEELHL